MDRSAPVVLPFRLHAAHRPPDRLTIDGEQLDVTVTARDRHGRVIPLPVGGWYEVEISRTRCHDADPASDRA